jgi:hypothetical protein
VYAASVVSVVSAASAASAANIEHAERAEHAAIAENIVNADAVDMTHVVKTVGAVAVHDALEDSTETLRNRMIPLLQVQNEAGMSSCNRQIQQSRNIRDD